MMTLLNPVRSQVQQKLARLGSSSTPGKFLLLELMERFKEEGDLRYDHSEWKKIQKDLCSDVRMRRSWSAMLMKQVQHVDQPEKGDSLIQYLRSQSSTINLATLSAYLKLQSAQIPGSRMEEVSRTFKQIHSTWGEQLDDSTIGVLMNAASHLGDLQSCQDLLKLVNSPSSKAHYSPLLQLTARLSLFTQFNTLIQEMLSIDLVPEMNDIEYFLKRTSLNESTSAKLSDIHGLLMQLDRKEIVLSRDCGRLLSDAVSQLTSSKWSLAEFRLPRLDAGNNDFARCPRCRQSLPELPVTDEDVRALRAALHEQLYGDRKWQQTTPAELNRFNKFLGTNGPFDVVIDGLNTSYQGLNVNDASRYVRSDNLLTAVQKTNALYGTSVCLLGRKHMKHWPHMSRLQSLVHVFLADDISEDDPFAIYAALSSGLGTNLLSADALRDHGFSLGPLLPLFHRWQRAHQILYVGVKDGRPLLLPPEASLRTTHITDSTIHLNVDDGNLRRPFSRSRLWFCLQRES